MIQYIAVTSLSTFLYKTIFDHLIAPHKLTNIYETFCTTGSSSLDSGSDGGSTGPEPFKRTLSARDSRAGSSAGTNKVFPKLAKLGGKIEEDAEDGKESSQATALVLQDSKQLQMRKLESYDGGLITQPSHEREILAAVLEVRLKESFIPIGICRYTYFFS